MNARLPSAQDAAQRGAAPPSPAVRAALVLAALAVGALAAERLWLIPLHVSFNPDEGWNAFQARRAFGADGPLYPPAGALTGDNYPPLSFLLVGGLARLTGVDAIVVGRCVSLAAVLATAAAVAAAVRRLEGVRTWAPAAAALVVLGFAATQFRGYLAMDDPQWLAHALMTPVLVLLIPARPGGAPSTGRTAAAALLTVAALLVKHNLLALPAAATLWLLLRHRRAFAVWALTGAVAAAAALAAVVAAYGADAVRDVLDVPRHASAARMLRAAAGPVLAEVPLLLAAGPLLRLRRTDPRLDLPLLFVAAAVPLGVYERSGQGVNYNAHFEALAALAAAAGAALSAALAAGDRRNAVRRVGLLLLPFAILVPLAAQAAWTEAAGLRRTEAAWSAMEGRIASAGGPTACQTLALCVWAGQPFVLDAFLYGQRVAAGASPCGLERALADGGIAAVELDAPHPLKRGDAPDPLPAIVQARTATVFVAPDGRRLQVARRGAPPRTGAAACP